MQFVDDGDEVAPSFSVKVNDGDVDSNTLAATVTYTAVNDAPVLDAGALPVLTAVAEDAGAPVGAVGTLVSSLVDLNPPAGGLDNVTDPDGSGLGIAVTAAATANGAWFYSVDNGASWSALGAVSDSSARLLAADAGTRLYFQPAADFDGDATITFRAWDRSSGSNGGLADSSVNGGSTAFSTATDTASVDVVSDGIDIDLATLDGTNGFRLTASMRTIGAAVSSPRRGTSMATASTT